MGCFHTILFPPAAMLVGLDFTAQDLDVQFQPQPGNTVIPLLPPAYVTASPVRLLIHELSIMFSLYQGFNHVSRRP